MVSAVHDLNIVAQFCDHVFALKEGSMVADGSSDELFTSAFIRELYETEAERVLDREGKPRIFFTRKNPDMIACLPVRFTKGFFLVERVEGSGKYVFRLLTIYIR